MSKLVICNNSDFYLSLNEMNKSGGLEDSFVFSEDTLNIVTYKKILIDNINTYECDCGFVSYVGTLIYKGKVGKCASQCILEDLADFSFKDIRSCCIGSYCLIVYREGELFAFVDETCTYRMYYWHDTKDFIITNTYYHIQKVVKNPLNIDSFNEFAVRKAIMSSDSPIKGVKKLLADEMIHVDKKRKLNIEKLELNDYSAQYVDVNEAIKDLCVRVNEINEERVKNFSRYMQFVTGGIDSRLELALLKDNRCNVKTAYWSGKDSITNGTSEDLRIAKELSLIQSREFTFFDVGEEYSEASTFLDNGLSARYGEYAEIYSGNKEWFGIFENSKDIEFFNFGYFGEVLRPLVDLDSAYYDGFSVDDFVKDVYCRTAINETIFRSEDLLPHIEHEFLDLCNKLGYGEKLSKTEAYNLFSFSRFEADCIVNNFINMFAYGFPIFSQKKISDAVFSMTYEMRAGEYIPLKMIDVFDERLLNVGFYSHHQAEKYDRKTNTLKSTAKTKIKANIKKRILNTFLYKDIYIKWFRNFVHPTENSTNSIVQFCKTRIPELGIVNDGIIELRDSEKLDSLGGAAIGDYFSLLFLIDSLYKEYMANKTLK